MKLATIRLYKLIFCLLVLIHFSVAGINAQNDSVYSDQSKSLRLLPIDSSSEIQLRTFHNAEIDSLNQLKEFQYHRNPSAKSGFSEWLMKLLSKILGRRITNIQIPEWMWYLVLSLIVIYIIYKIFKSNFKPVFYNPVNRSRKDDNSIPLDITIMNFDELIAGSLAEKDYRSALRYNYLKFLKILIDKEIVQFKKGKSNHDYQREVAKLPVSVIFNRLTLVYEWVWYGKLYLEFRDYSELGTEFENACKELNE